MPVCEIFEKGDKKWLYVKILKKGDKKWLFVKILKRGGKKWLFVKILKRGDKKWLFVKFLSKIMTFSFQERKFGFRLNRETCFDITKTFDG